MIGAYFGDLAKRLLILLEPYSDAELSAIERLLEGVPASLTPEPTEPTPTGS